MESQTHPSGVSGWSAMMPWNIRLFFLFCSKSYLWRSIFKFRKSFNILDSILTSSPASHRGCGSSSPIYPWSCSPRFLPPEILICTLASAKKNIIWEATKTYHMHPLSLVGGSWYLRKWEVYKIFQSPVLLRHGQSREFYQCTQPEIDLNQIWMWLLPQIRSKATLHSLILPSSQPIISLALRDSSTTFKVSRSKIPSTGKLWLFY